MNKVLEIYDPCCQKKIIPLALMIPFLMGVRVRPLNDLKSQDLNLLTVIFNIENFLQLIIHRKLN